MSQNLRLLTEEESAQIAEVSIDTIRKYRDCGLLDPILKENKTFFQELDIRTLFYAKFKERERTSTSTPAAKPNPDILPPMSPQEVVDSAAAPNSSVLVPPAPSEPKPEFVAAARTVAEPPKPDLVAQPQVAAGNPETVEPDPAVVEPLFEQSIKVEAVQPKPADTLPAANEMLELTKSLREQIHVLRDERDWLRERVEKLESRSEREQMLLLSESENVRKLIGSNKSFWQRALPWFSNQ